MLSPALSTDTCSLKGIEAVTIFIFNSTSSNTFTLYNVGNTKYESLKEYWTTIRSFGFLFGFCH